MNNDEQLQQAFVQWLAQKTGAKSEADLQKIVQQLGEDGLKQAYQQFMQEMQGQQAVQSARNGAKLYMQQLKGLCPEGYEVKYFKQGGSVCSKCVKSAQKGQKVPKKSTTPQASKPSNLSNNARKSILKNPPAQKRPVSPDDTVHVNNGPRGARSLTDYNGNRFDTRFPPYSKDEYQDDLKGKNGKSGLERAVKQDSRTAKNGCKIKKPLVKKCGGVVKKACGGSKMK